MNFKTFMLYNKLFIFCILITSSLNTATAAPGTLTDTPLFTTNSAPPIVFFEVDDSGSMDWEILTKNHWWSCAYTAGFNDCGFFITNGLHIGFSGNAFGNLWYYFYYLFDNNDDAYANGCNTNLSTIELCTGEEDSDWRVKSSSLNVMYYDPSITYTPWQVGDGTTMPAATFSAARSDPQVGTAGYTEIRNLNGLIYHNWIDSHGFATARPQSNPVNKTAGANGIVDWWDEHVMFTVNSTSITIDNITYTGAGNNETTTNVTTLTGTGPHPELNGRTIAEEQQNIANWYQYYRRRSFIAKAAVSDVISANPNYRYGLNFINNSTFPHNGVNTTFIEVPPGNATIPHNTALISGLNDLDWPAFGTPLRTGLERSGNYFDNTDGRVDPITEQCQQNFSVLFTDGYWNGGDPSATIGDADGDGSSDINGVNSTVADVAKYFYDTDLNTALPNTVITNIFDTATHQHMVTFTVAFGVTGLLTDTDNDGWPGNAPGLLENGNWGNPFNSTPEKIDDLWHAAFNSKGTFVSASTPSDVSQALTSALSNISNRVGSAASVAFNTTTLTSNSAVYLAQFNSSNNKWSGDILSFLLDPLTGDVSATPAWSAASILDARPNPVTSRKIFTYNGTSGVPFQWADLTVAQQDDLKINPNFTISGIPEAQARLDFIRGDRTNDQGNNGTYTFRNRINLLGDIVHSDPTFIGTPHLFWPSSAPFPSTIGTNTHNDFKASSIKNRQAMIYVGSNDGMLHGFNASTGDEEMAYIPNSIFSSSSATSGLHYLTDVGYTHKYYVDMPVTISDVYIDKGDLIDRSGDGDLLDWHTVLIGGGRAGSRGLFALDITDPTQFIEDATHAQKLVLWEFDQTDDPDLGFTFSQPTISMMNNGRWAAIFGNGYNGTGDGEAKLFILFLDGGLDGVWTDGSGGSNLDYIEIATGVGTITASDCQNGASNCNGLSTPQPVDLNGDFVVDRVYAGDLHGNMWVFDVSSNSTNSWDVAYKTGATPKPLFTATHHATTPPAVPVQISATAQAITQKPILVKHPDALGGAPDVLVFFGTGQYLNSTDINNSAVQSFYGVWDNGSHSLTPANLIEQTFLSQTFSNGVNNVTNRVRVLTNNSVNYTGTDKGWFINLTLDSGERVIVDPDIRGSLVFFNTWIPDTNPCSAGGSGFLMSVNQLDGGSPTQAAFDLNGDGTVDSADLVSVTTVVNGVTVVTNYAPAGESFNSGLPASSNFLSNKQYTPGSDGGSTIETREVEDLGGLGTGRLSWQELR